MALLAMTPVLRGIYFVSAFEESGFIPEVLEVVILRKRVHHSECSFSVAVQNHHPVVVSAQNGFWHLAAGPESAWGHFSASNGCDN